MMCNCIDMCNEELKDKNTRIERSFSMTGTMPNAMIVTEKVDAKKRVGPVRLFAAYCPFCGVEYKPEAHNG